MYYYNTYNYVNSLYLDFDNIFVKKISKKLFIKL